MQFYEIDLPHASAVKQKLVQKVLPDAKKVSSLHFHPAHITLQVGLCQLFELLCMLTMHEQMV